MSNHNHGHRGDAGWDRMLEGLVGGGDASGMLRRVVGGDDRSFWTGAMIGAGAVLLLTNPQVKQTLSGLFSKAGGEATEPAIQPAKAAKAKSGAAVKPVRRKRAPAKAKAAKPAVAAVTGGE